MSKRYCFASLTRISNLPEISFSPMPLPKAQWSTGDYVVGEANHPHGLSSIELANGRMINAGEFVGFFTHGYPQYYVDRLIAQELQGEVG